jgi:hypothetical protein
MSSKANTIKTFGIFLGLCVSSLAQLRCSSAELEALPVLPEVPDYVGLPHPSGMDRSDLQSIFLTEAAPKPVTLKECDSNFKQLKSYSQSFDEIQRGALEMVRADPVKYHWCFYFKLSELEIELTQNVLLKERQKLAISNYFFLAPIAKAFRHEYNDSRYLRWAIQNYQKMSEWIFYRRVDLTPEAKNEWLSGLEGPISLTPKEIDPDQSVLQKYQLKESPPRPKPSTPIDPPAQAAAPGVQDSSESAFETDTPPEDREPASASKTFEDDLFADE